MRSKEKFKNRIGENNKRTLSAIKLTVSFCKMKSNIFNDFSMHVHTIYNL